MKNYCGWTSGTSVMGHIEFMLQIALLLQSIVRIECILFFQWSNQLKMHEILLSPVRSLALHLGLPWPPTRWWNGTFACSDDQWMDWSRVCRKIPLVLYIHHVWFTAHHTALPLSCIHHCWSHRRFEVAPNHWPARRQRLAVAVQCCLVCVC